MIPGVCRRRKTETADEGKEAQGGHQIFSYVSRGT